MYNLLVFYIYRLILFQTMYRRVSYICILSVLLIYAYYLITMYVLNADVIVRDIYTSNKVESMFVSFSHQESSPRRRDTPETERIIQHKLG